MKQDKYFARFDATSGFHQILVDKECQHLLNIVTRGICSSGDLFNYITDENVKLDEDLDCLKNIGDFLLYSSTLEGLQEQIGKLMKLCKCINLKLSPPKFKLSEAVKFGGISAEKIKEQSIMMLEYLH